MSDENQTSKQRNHIIYIRRRPCSSWLGWLLWVVILGNLLEYAFSSFAEHESQAGIVVVAMFVGLLLAGLILEFIKIAEGRSMYHRMSQDEEVFEEGNDG